MRGRERHKDQTVQGLTPIIEKDEIMMLKSRTILLIGIACLILTACGGNNEVKSNEKDKEVQAPVDTIAPVSKTPESAEKGSESGQAFEMLIPEGWQIVENNQQPQAEVEGDLNGDNIVDKVAVIEEKTQSDTAKRGLLIAFGTSDNGYVKSILADTAILQSNEGGAFGDPFESIEMDRGSVVINFYGGSNWRWYKKYRFRYQDQGWYLIGATLGSYFTGDTTIENADEEDYNFLTGDYTERKKLENGEMETKTGNKGKKELVNLKDFIANSEEEQF